MSSSGTPWQQILGIAQNTPTSAANTANGLPSGAGATPGLTTGLPISQYTNPNAVTPQQASQNIAGATGGAQAIQNQVRQADMASNPNSAQNAALAQQQANQLAGSIPTPDQAPNTTNNPSATIPGLATQPGLACGGMVERKALGGPMAVNPQNPFASQAMPGQQPVGVPPTGQGGVVPNQQMRPGGMPGYPMAPRPTINRPIGGGGMAPGAQPPMPAPAMSPAMNQMAPQAPRPMAGGGMVGMKGMHPIAKIHVQTIHPLRMTNPLGSSGSFAEGGAMEEGRTDHIDPGTSEFETHAMGGQIENMADGARHLRSVHHLLPKSAQPHIEKAHKAALDEMHNAAFGKGAGMAGETEASPAAGPGMGSEGSDSAPEAAPQTPTTGAPEFKKGGEVKPKEHKADMKEEAKKKKDHEKKSAGGAIRGKAGEESDAKAEPARYARGGMVDPGTTEFSCGSPSGKGTEKTARGMGAAKRGGEFSYKHGGRVKK
jgi:hypothetical protein